MSSDEKGTTQTATGWFEWQTTNAGKIWNRYVFDLEKYWGGVFPKELPPDFELFRDYPWAVGPFTKHGGNPILHPTPGGWDCGHFDGGVHNGAIVRHDGTWYYIYRGERPIDFESKSDIDYVCDIGIATSTDGIRFTKDDAHSPLFRRGDARRFSYEDVNIARSGDTWYLFCNQWDWERFTDPRFSGTFLATSRDLLHWEPRGIVFPDAARTHRNAVVLQTPENEAVRVNGRFVMHINDGLMAYSDDMVHWESREIAHQWPGGEGCFALAGHDPARPDDIILFTGGHHCGHFYAVGQVLFSMDDPEKPLAWLPRPVLEAEGDKYPWENGCDANPPHEPLSGFRDCIFFNGLTRHDGRYWVYYGGSEYYTCLATAPVAR